MTDQTTPAVTVDASKLQAVAITFFAALIAVASGTATLISMLSAHDMAAVYKWLQSAPAAGYFTALATVCSIGTLLLRSAVRKAREVYLAWHAPNDIAGTSKPIAEPPVPPASMAEAAVNLITTGSISAAKP